MKDFTKVKSNRWNLIVMAVNEGRSKDSLTPSLNADESELYDVLLGELKEARKSFPGANLGPIEEEW